MISRLMKKWSIRQNDETEKPSGETVAAVAENTDESETVEAAEEKVTDNLPEKDFGGMDFVIYTRKNYAFPFSR